MEPNLPPPFDFVLFYMLEIKRLSSDFVCYVLFVTSDPTNQPVLVHDDPVSFHNSREPGQMRYGICQTVRDPECLYQAIWGKYIGKRSECPELGCVGVRLLVGQTLKQMLLEDNNSLLNSDIGNSFFVKELVCTRLRQTNCR